jgi:hypothetical protein
VRGGVIVQIKIPSGMGQGFGGEEGKGERSCIFRRKRWNEEQSGKSGKREERVRAKKMSAPVQDVSS